MKTLLIVGRLWFSGGNTYHTAEVFIDGERAAKTPMTYGYENQFETTGLEAVAHLLPDREVYANGSKENFRDYFARIGVTFASTKVDVSRKRDL